MHMQHGHEAQKFRTDMKHDKQHGNAAENAYTLLNVLAFPPVKWILTLELDFKCGAAKVGSANSHFSFLLSALAFSCAFFFALLTLLRACEQESSKKARTSTSANHESTETSHPNLPTTAAA
jgi:hypothetical protein